MATAVAFDSRLDGLAHDRRELDALEAEWLARVADYARSREWQTDGFLSAAAAIQQRCRMNGGAARAAVHLAATLPKLPAVTKAFEAGRISRQHAAVIADAWNDERAEELARQEAELVNVARNTDPRRLRAVVRHVTDAIDGDGGARTDKEDYDRNRLHLSPVAGRGAIDGAVDLESLEILMTAVDAMQAALRQPGDKRRRSAKQAEALVEICRRSLTLDHRANPSRRRGRPNLSYVVDLGAYDVEHPRFDRGAARGGRTRRPAVAHDVGTPGV